MEIVLGPVMEAVADVVVVVDLAGMIVHANSAALLLSGYEHAELAAIPVASFLVDEHSGLRTGTRQRVVSDHQVVRRDEAWLVTKTGERIVVSLSAAPVLDEEGTTTGIVLVARDIREQRDLLAARDAEIARREAAETELRSVMATIEERLAQTRSQLTLAERRATLGTLAGGVGHELRNIAQIHAFALDRVATELARKGSSDEGRAAMLELARVGEHIATHARRLLQLAQPGPDHTSELDIKLVIRDVVAMLLGAGKLHQVDVVFALPDAPVLVTVNKTRIDQIFVNLVLNAAEAIGSSTGSIELAVRLDPEHRRVVLEVRDTGPGIPADVLPRIFEPFFTTKGADNGTGLGLPVVREIVESYGGTLTASSTIGAKTTFRFDLPMSSGR